MEHEKGFEVLEVLVVIGGHDKALGRDTHASYSYGINQVLRGVHFKNQLFFCPNTRINFVDISIFDQLEWDMSLVNEHRLRKVFGALKTNWREARGLQEPTSANDHKFITTQVMQIKNKTSVEPLQRFTDKSSNYSGNLVKSMVPQPVDDTGSKISYSAMHHASNWIESVRASDSDTNIHAAMDIKGKKLPRLAPVMMNSQNKGFKKLPSTETDGSKYCRSLKVMPVDDTDLLELQRLQRREPHHSVTPKKSYHK
jgi:hypothetical protein